MNLGKLGETQILEHLEAYVQAFSPEAREIFEHFHFSEFLELLDKANLLYLVVQKFAKMDLSPATISNYEMGLAFEELIRKVAESSNETAGEHFTPRDIVHLATSLVFMDDDESLTQSGAIRTLYDPTAGTGGFLSEGTALMSDMNENAVISVFGQELNPESYAICKGDMILLQTCGKAIARRKLLSGLLVHSDRGDLVFNYIEMFYNPVRRHGHNEHLSPIEFENRFVSNAEGV